MHYFSLSFFSVSIIGTSYFFAHFATTPCIAEAHSKDPAPGDNSKSPSVGISYCAPVLLVRIWRMYYYQKRAMQKMKISLLSTFYIIIDDNVNFFITPAPILNEERI